MKGGGDKYDWMEVNSQMKCMISLSRIRYMIYTLLRNKGDISMAEAIISRRGWSSEGKPPPAPTFVLTTKTFTSNTSWVVPNHNGPVSVRIFGGGGAGAEHSGGGGGGGWMNNGDLTLANGSSIPITIGAGGITNYKGNYDGGAGGSSSFGIWLSANGGEGGEFSQYGQGNGGDGGSGGGGGWNGSGGRGYQFGGGGGGWYANTGGLGGPWGGAGGSRSNNGRNGINTMSNSSIPNDCRGWGRAGIGGARNMQASGQQSGGWGGGGGGGGLGGNGGNGQNGSDAYASSGGGGGGFGGNGGRGMDYTSRLLNGGGGGGSYGDGGDAGSKGRYGGGGGGGYNGNGGGGICIVQYYAES